MNGLFISPFVFRLASDKAGHVLSSLAFYILAARDKLISVKKSSGERETSCPNFAEGTSATSTISINRHFDFYTVEFNSYNLN